MNNHIKSKRSGFTLVELLVVMAILALLIGLLLPKLLAGIGNAKFAKCKHNLHVIGTGVMGFIGDHWEVLPGIDDELGEEDDEADWLGTEVYLPGYSGGDEWNPTNIGTIARYMRVGGGNVIDLFRCPSLKSGELGTARDDFVRSNGMFDYTMIKAFAGAKISVIPGRSLLFEGEAHEFSGITPLIVEEDPRHSCNNQDINTGHSDSDRMGTWHNGRGNYLGLDGSVNFVDASKFPVSSRRGGPTEALGPQCSEWRPAGVDANGQELEIWGDVPYGKWHNTQR